MKDTAQYEWKEFFEFEGVDVPTRCSRDHDLTEEGAVRIETCRFTSRKRWRCRTCAKHYAKIARDSKQDKIRIIAEAFDEEIIGRLVAIAKRSRDTSPMDLLRNIVTRTIEQLEERVMEATASRRGPKSGD